MSQAPEKNHPTRLIHGFHAVIAKLRHNPDAVKEVYLDQSRKDGRAKDLLRHAEAQGIRVIPADAKRIDGLAPGQRHQGVVAKVDANERQVTLDDVLTPWKSRPCCWCWMGSPIPTTWGPACGWPTPLAPMP